MYIDRYCTCTGVGRVASRAGRGRHAAQNTYAPAVGARVMVSSAMLLHLHLLLGHATVLLAAVSAQQHTQDVSESPVRTALRPWMNASIPRSQRLQNLVGSMTTAEKLTQLVHKAPGVPRIGLPAYVYSGTCNHGEAGPDGPKGPRISTVFPQSLALAETWDLDGIHAVGRATADEARAEYNAGYRPGMHSWGPKCDANTACARLLPPQLVD